jgi:WD40 repeat protein
LVSGSEDKTLKLWDAGNGKELRSLTGHSGGFSPDGRQLVSGSTDQTLKLWDAASGKELRSLTGHSGEVLACGFSPDGRQLVSGSFDQTLKLWDARSGRELGSWTLGWIVLSVAFHPQQHHLVVCALDNGTLAMVDLRVK